MPISTPAPSTTAQSPWDVASSTSPIRYSNAPPTISGRNPVLTASAPANGCNTPQVRFCTATAIVKSPTEIPMSRVSGGTKMPRLCRSPMASDSMTEAPIRMGKAGRSEARRDMRRLLLLAACVQAGSTIFVESSMKIHPREYR
ncbi:hypothetical protein D3C81_1314110 [compost metagenome]